MKNKIIDNFNFLMKKRNFVSNFFLDIFMIRKRKYNELTRLLENELLPKYSVATLKEIEMFMLDNYYREEYETAKTKGKKLDTYLKKQKYNKC
jgi:hypothetical protein